MNKAFLNIYNNLIKLTRNKSLYKSLKNNDTFSDRLIILLFHFGFFLKFYKKELSKKEAQNLFDFFIRQIELSIREIGYGDVSVNKKMKDLNKIFYDILLKLSDKTKNFSINQNLYVKYFEKLKNSEEKRDNFHKYFTKFYNYCFELSANNMIEDIQNFKY